MKRFKSTLLTGFIAAVLVFASLGTVALVAWAQGGTTNTPTVQSQKQAVPNETNEATETNEAAETNEANEAAALQGQAAITQADAEAAALAANSGATVVKTALDKENGVLVYDVKLDNGIDVTVDANTGAVLTSAKDNEANETAEGVETADNDKDQTQVQEEHQSQADDATEVPGAEDAVGQ